ncbi:MAG: ABC transporter ATP-binding protein [Opitutales bacterium]|nr:ABC transporter ATP-binding protein [Opitutales bacterium]|tara:strand:+ start:271 stop:948 length:678 start_codon:yes stop_codon:yes gene_type:complete
MKVIAELRNVSRTYQMGGIAVHALDGISVPFGAKEYWAIMGASGSGKSTLLNILGCIDRPTGGSYFVDGCDTNDLDDDDLSRLRGASIGFIFQSFNLIPQLNLLENIMVPLFYQDGSTSDGVARAEHLAERVGLADRLLHRPSELSGGQQQRVAIARALINDPKIILADEATGNLDSQTASEILDIFSELHSEGKTILLVTHEEKISHQAQRVLRLRDGKVDLIK